MVDCEELYALEQKGKTSDTLSLSGVRRGTYGEADVEDDDPEDADDAFDDVDEPDE